MFLGGDVQSMYTILMNNDKSLIASVRTTIYQRENLVDKIQFLCPQKYDDVNLADYVAVLKYVDQGNELHFEVLAKDSELYKNRLRYILPVDTKLTRFAGNVSVRILFVQDISYNSLLNPVLKTGDNIITITKDETIIYSPDVAASVSVLQNRVTSNEKSIDELKSGKADNISYDNKSNQLSLKSGDIVLGTATLEDCEEGIPIVDIGSGNEITPVPDEEDNVVIL